MENDGANQDFIIEENTRKALLRYGGDAEKVRAALKQPLAKVLKIHTKMKKDLIEDPSTSLNIAANITQEIVNGRNQRKQVLQDMLDSLESREQIWVCVECDTEVKDMVFDSNTGVEHYCPKCDIVVNRILKDRGHIYDQKQSLLEKMMIEDDKLLGWLVKMGWTGSETPPGPTTVVHSRQNVLVLGDRKEGDPIVTDKENKLLDEIRHLPPLEAEKLRKDLKEEIITIDDEIRDAESEITETEEA